MIDAGDVKRLDVDVCSLQRGLHCTRLADIDGLVPLAMDQQERRILRRDIGHRARSAGHRFASGAGAAEKAAIRRFAARSERREVEDSVPDDGALHALAMGRRRRRVQALVAARDGYQRGELAPGRTAPHGGATGVSPASRYSTLATTKPSLASRARACGKSASAPE